MSLIVGIWLTMVTAGVCAIWHHDGIPGPVTQVKRHWPSGDWLPRADGMFTLLMIVHPQCPCTRASLNELESLLTRCGGRVSAVVLFVESGGVRRSWENSDLWQDAASIRGVACQRDIDGQVAAQFGAATSGQVYLYNAKGLLEFSGGITASRGHGGDNDGVDAIQAIVNGDQPMLRETPVFGCSIR